MLHLHKSSRHKAHEKSCPNPLKSLGIARLKSDSMFSQPLLSLWGAIGCIQMPNERFVGAKCGYLMNDILSSLTQGPDVSLNMKDSIQPALGYLYPYSK